MYFLQELHEQEIKGAFSIGSTKTEVGLILIISEGETIQIFMNFNHNEYYAFSVGRFFIWIFFRNAHLNIACHVSIFDDT